jgi:hypothetical protein
MVTTKKAAIEMPPTMNAGRYVCQNLQEIKAAKKETLG